MNKAEIRVCNIEGLWRKAWNQSAYAELMRRK